VTEVIPGFAAYSEDRWDGETLAILGDDLSLLLHLRRQNFFVTVARKPKTALPEGLVATLKDVVPPAKPKSKNLIPFLFWAASKDGANSIGRDITVPAWEEIQRNYPQVPETR
jgi:hypothetical protein